jgi:aspartyl/asparaginyl-tRNA synthetase
LFGEDEMNRKDELLFKAFVLKSMRKFFEIKGIPEIRYNQFSFAGSCESAPTTYWVEKAEQFLMLPQTRQIMAEDDLIRHGFDAVYMMQTSYRDEPRAGDGRHTNQFLLCEMEHRNMTQKELIKFEIEMLRFMIKEALDYFDRCEEPITTKQNIGRLKYTLEQDIPIVSYTDMIEKLQEKGVSVNWGADFGSRDEEFICGMFADIPIPVAVMDYPEKLKYFNMYLKRDTEGTDKEVVECCDLLLPYAGETWGASRRENEGKRIRERFYNGIMYKQLKERLMEKVSDEEAEQVIKTAFEPYFKLFDDEPKDRAGFGLGVGRLAQFLLGKTTIVEM